MNQCSNCHNEIPKGRSVCAVCGTVGDDSSTPATLPEAGAATAGAAQIPLDHGRFIAGTVLAGRYRIIGLLGRGGMGEVYKAEDLSLHQLVALKFLPEAFSGDPSMVARFHREVRTARRITHPNVCRVHDIGQIPFSSTTLHFISMEYIDGEDLAALLRRIGHLPVQKGMELARQICAGLSAAHEMGVLHRDLKPSNVMLDGRGRARITDFGLSGLAEEFGRDERSGTPAYMAPEQLKGAPATNRSDLYALGLVLYEIFTGKRPFEGRNVAELIDQHRRSTPPPPSSRAREIDPAAERAILRCLAREPGDRPAEALEILSALSGGDPLGKAIAAGETPSPEMVAAAGQKIGFLPGVAWSCLIAIAVVCFAVVLPLNPARARNRSLGLSPDFLVNTAKKIIRDLEYSELPDSSYDFTIDEKYVSEAHKDRDPAAFQSYLSESRPSWARFRFQETAEGRMSGGTGFPVYARLGANLSGGQQEVMHQTRNVILDPQGWLIEFYAFPDFSPGQDDATPDWNVLFKAAGIDRATLTPVQPKSFPPIAFDSRAAWEGTWPEHPDIAMTVEAASWRGKPVYFQILGPGSLATAPPKGEAVRLQVFTAINIGVIIFILVIGTAIPLARHNMRAGRGDERGAFRVGMFIFVVLLLSWILGTSHRFDAQELSLFVAATGEALFRSIVVGLLYLAIEPFVRQRWPHALIPWNRVLEGRFRDPVVGRAVLTGIVLAAVNAVLRNGLLVSEVMSPELPDRDLLMAMVSNSSSVSFLLARVSDSCSIPFALFALFSTFRILLRNKWLAGAAFIAIVNAYVNFRYFETPGIVLATVYSVLWLVGVLRFGLIAGMSMWLADSVFRAWSMLAPAGWYSGRLYFFMAAVLVLSVYAFVTSVGAQRIMPLELLGKPRDS